MSSFSLSVAHFLYVFVTFFLDTMGLLFVAALILWAASGKKTFNFQSRGR